MTRQAPVGVGWVVCVGVLHGGLYCLCVCLPDRSAKFKDIVRVLLELFPRSCGEDFVERKVEH